jgi:simple sugar transport system substrate-binding protein
MLRKLLAAALGVCGLVLAGAAAQSAERIVFVGHWPESDSFFNVIRNSAQLAATQMGVTVEFRNPPGGDLSQMAGLIDQAVASKPSAIISTVPDDAFPPDGLNGRPVFPRSSG